MDVLTVKIVEYDYYNHKRGRGVFKISCDNFGCCV